MIAVGSRLSAGGRERGEDVRSSFRNTSLPPSIPELGILRSHRVFLSNVRLSDTAVHFINSLINRRTFTGVPNRRAVSITLLALGLPGPEQALEFA
jgi:hypothetical protein